MKTIMLISCLFAILPSAVCAKSPAEKGFSYDSVIITPEKEKYDSRVFIRGNSMRMETQKDGIKHIIISDGSSTYLYTPSNNTAIRYEAATAASAMNTPDTSSPEILRDTSGYLKKMNAKKTGSEKIDGKMCDVYRIDDIDTGTIHTLWLWNNEFPLMQSFANEEGLTTVMTKNLKTGLDIPDSHFALPDNAHIVDMSRMMREMPQMRGGRKAKNPRARPVRYSKKDSFPEKTVISTQLEQCNS